METVGGRVTSGLQGENGQVGSAPDRLGGLDLIAGRRQHSGQSGSVCTYVPAFCCSEKETRSERTTEIQSEWRSYQEATKKRLLDNVCYSLSIFVLLLKDNKKISR